MVTSNLRLYWSTQTVNALENVNSYQRCSGRNDAVTGAHGLSTQSQDSSWQLQATFPLRNGLGVLIEQRKSLCREGKEPLSFIQNCFSARNLRRVHVSPRLAIAEGNLDEHFKSPDTAAMMDCLGRVSEVLQLFRTWWNPGGKCLHFANHQLLREAAVR